MKSLNASRRTNVKSKETDHLDPGGTAVTSVVPLLCKRPQVTPPECATHRSCFGTSHGHRETTVSTSFQVASNLSKNASHHSVLLGTKGRSPHDSTNESYLSTVVTSAIMATYENQSTSAAGGPKSSKPLATQAGKSYTERCAHLSPSTNAGAALLYVESVRRLGALIPASPRFALQTWCHFSTGQAPTFPPTQNRLQPSETT